MIMSSGFTTEVCKVAAAVIPFLAVARRLSLVVTSFNTLQGYGLQLLPHPVQNHQESVRCDSFRQPSRDPSETCVPNVHPESEQYPLLRKLMETGIGSLMSATLGLLSPRESSGWIALAANDSDPRPNPNAVFPVYRSDRVCARIYLRW